MEDGEFSLSLSNQLFEKVSPFSRTWNYSEEQSTRDISIWRPRAPTFLVSGEWTVDALDENNQKPEPENLGSDLIVCMRSIVFLSMRTESNCFD